MTPLGLFGSLGPSLLAFTLHRPWSIGVNLRLTFTTHRRPPCRIHHLHITSQEQRHTHMCCQSLITQRERTSLGSSAAPQPSSRRLPRSRFSAPSPPAPPPTRPQPRRRSSD